MKSVTLDNWQYKASDSDKWSNSKPGDTCEIHPDLEFNGEIPPLFEDDNERHLQWIGEKDWEYKSTFQNDGGFSTYQLIFEGLDTFADVYLNGELILSTESMFIEYTVDVTGKVKEGANELRIYFKAAIFIARDLEKKHFKALGFNGESSRMQIRKAQYHYGWDWGPNYMTCGPYRPIRFIGYDYKIDDVYVKTTIKSDVVDVEVESDIIADKDLTFNIEVTDPDGSVENHKATVHKGKNSTKFTIKDAKLWFPFSHGTPYLYNFKFTLVDDKVVHEIQKKIGMRKVELIQETFDDQEGTSFYFKVNDVPIYSSGSNWIPGHSFQTELTTDDYEKWLQLMVDGYQNMIRIWGGGYYEQDVFYDLCDEKGILIWHDFMFACGQYPGYKEFIDLVSEEVRTQLKRIRNHCSLTVFAGNNEDYQVAEQRGLTWDKDDLSGDYSKTNFPARTIYENTLPTLMKKYLESVPYHPGSPWGGKESADPTVGDMHQWNVWHGNQEKYQDWYRLGGRFVSEFGMEALPSRKTYEQCITDKTELYPQSYLVDFHNKADGFERRLALYVIENIKVEGLDFDSWIYATQLMQSECLGYAYRCWRREWRGDKKRYSSGAIVWQINDCWPVASWALIDFYRRPKLAYYSVKRESKPLGVGMYRNQWKKPDPNLDVDQKEGAPFDYREVHYNIDIWGVNSSLTDVEGELKVDVYNVTTGEVLDSFSENVVMKSNQTTEFVKEFKITNKSPVVVYSRVVKDGTIICSAADWPQPIKYLKFPDREVKITVEDGQVTLSTNKPVKGVEILLENDNFIHDNGFDIFPGDGQVVKVNNLKKTDVVKINYYQKGY
ncbi:putative beta-mannosidase B [[Candida] jaroonii]|uniref:Beta-mannosidase B n=1 Tax=[Candida] jaroonii TaxID=467808 RepID=A0ACA9Y732_9ASCO|nr:putative beta-mannosidase B [[Candida] jaroonii]